MTARYRRINMLQEPTDIGLDANGRARFAFNILAVKTPSEVFEEEIIEILTTAAAPVAVSVIFAGTTATIPDGDDAVLHIVATGGTEPEEIQNEIGAYPRPAAQLTAHAGKLKDARALAYLAYNALKVVRNQTVTAT